MTPTTPKNGLVIRAARAHVYPHCPLKWGPERENIDSANPCELRCDLFHHLPAISDAAACADPMLRPVAAAAAGEIAIRVPAWRKTRSPLWRNRRRLIAMLVHLFGG
jgi:hypothetical protein